MYSLLQKTLKYYIYILLKATSKIRSKSLPHFPHHWKAGFISVKSSVKSCTHTWKKRMLPPVRGPFCVVRRRPKFLDVLHSFVCRRPYFWAFLRSFARRRLKNWISVCDWITGAPGLFNVCVQYLYSLIKLYRKIRGVTKCKLYVLQVDKVVFRHINDNLL